MEWAVRRGVTVGVDVDYVVLRYRTVLVCVGRGGVHGELYCNVHLN